jgi:hypothetical protein
MFSTGYNTTLCFTVYIGILLVLAPYRDLLISCLQNVQSKSTLLPFKKVRVCEKPAISLCSRHVSLVQWTNPLLPDIRYPGSNTLGNT